MEEDDLGIQISRSLDASWESSRIWGVKGFGAAYAEGPRTPMNVNFQNTA